MHIAEILMHLFRVRYDAPLSTKNKILGVATYCFLILYWLAILAACWFSFYNMIVMDIIKTLNTIELIWLCIFGLLVLVVTGFIGERIFKYVKYIKQI